MRIEVNSASVTMSGSEMYDIAHCVLSRLKRDIDTHWVAHQNAFNSALEVEKLSDIANQFFKSSGAGHIDAIAEVQHYAKEAFEVYNKKHNKQ